MSSEMAKVRNKSKADLFVPCLNREVAADEVVDVPGPLVDALVCQSIWELVEPAPKHEPAAKKAASKS